MSSIVSQAKLLSLVGKGFDYHFLRRSVHVYLFIYYLIVYEPLCSSSIRALGARSESNASQSGMPVLCYCSCERQTCPFCDVCIHLELPSRPAEYDRYSEVIKFICLYYFNWHTFDFHFGECIIVGKFRHQRYS